MKSKRFFQILLLLALLLSSFGNNAPVYASSRPENQLDPVILHRNLDAWDGTHLGYVSSSIHENWQVEFTEYHNFIVTVNPILGNFLPVLILFDDQGNELAGGIGTLMSAQAAGNYSIQVQPQTGSGFYLLTLRNVIPSGPSTTTLISSSSLDVGETATVTIALNGVPTEGYTSTEFTCAYDANLLQVRDILATDLFGDDPAMAINGPQNGSFIVAIAGSQGNKATADGAAFTFNVKALQPGQTTLDCAARVSKGDNLLTAIDSIPASLTIAGNLSTPTATPTIPPALCDKAEFIADVTVPSGTVMSPGQYFIKTWRLKNVGTCTWTTSYRTAFFSGEQMSAPSSAQFPTNVEPGETVDISINMTAPTTPGSYRGYWIFQNSTGALFGVGALSNEPWFVDILVSGATITPGPTFTPSPTLTATQTPITYTPSPSITPGGPTATPIPDTVYDFAANICTATWFSGAGQLPCPGIDGNANGFAFRVDNPHLETGAVDTRPAILAFPQDAQNGYIQGFYPPFHVQDGDRFRSTITCEFGATSCYAAFRLDYQVGSDPIKTFWGPFLERYDGFNYSVDVNLSALAGKDVKFILTVLAAGQASGDRMLWVGPIIVRMNAGSTPTPSETVTPSQSPTPTQTSGGTLSGQVLASKPITIQVYDANHMLIRSEAANVDGTFTLQLSPGTYSVIATASGFLSAQGSVTITNNNTMTLPGITLIAGDIDNNKVIDPFDALTIGISYNASVPTAADLNDDGIINVLDLELLAKNYRKTGPIVW